MTILRQLPHQLQLSDVQLTILGGAGVRTADDLHGLLSAFPSLANRFGIPSNRITSAMTPMLSAAYASAAVATPPPPGMGAVAPGGETRSIGTVAGIPPQPSLPVTHPQVTGVATTIDLRLSTWPVRDQGQRGTCVAFGSTACVEHWFARTEPPNPDFSEQFLYYQIKTSSGDPNKQQDGTWLQFAQQMLHTYGLCREATDPYVGPGTINPVSGAPPSAPAIAEALTFVVNPTTYIRDPGGQDHIAFAERPAGRSQFPRVQRSNHAWRADELDNTGSMVVRACLRSAAAVSCQRRTLHLHHRLCTGHNRTEWWLLHLSKQLGRDVVGRLTFASQLPCA
jgi:hypothetical protein